MLVVKVLPKGQITLPQKIRKMMRIREGDMLLLDTDGEQAILKKAKTIFDFKGSLPNPGMSVEALREKAVSGAADEGT